MDIDRRPALRSGRARGVSDRPGLTDRQSSSRKRCLMANSTGLLHLAVALDGAGWHPTAWREPDARPAELFTARYWVDVVQEAERGLLDFVTLEDELRLQSDDAFAPDERVDRVRGRLD